MEIRKEKIPGEISLIWYKDSVFLILAIVSWYVSDFFLYKVGILNHPESIPYLMTVPLVYVIIIGLLCLAWLSGMFSVFFFAPICLISLPNEIKFWMIDTIAFTGNSLVLIDYQGKIRNTFPYSQIRIIRYGIEAEIGIRNDHPSQGDYPPVSVRFEMEHGKNLLVMLRYIVQTDRKKFLDLITGIVPSPTIIQVGDSSGPY